MFENLTSLLVQYSYCITMALGNDYYNALNEAMFFMNDFEVVSYFVSNWAESVFWLTLLCFPILGPVW